MKIDILGVKINNVTMSETLQKIEGFLNDGRQHYIVTPNPEMFILARKDEEFRKILNEADLAVPDGMGLVYASKFLGMPFKERVAGVDLVQKLCKFKNSNFKLFLLGGRGDTAEKAANNLQNLYSNINIAGADCGGYVHKSGGMNMETEKIVLDKINKTKPDILLVAFGAPKQEKWIYYNLKKMPSVKLAIGVGGAFDFISGRIKRAPAIIQKLGLEWAWRLAREPERAPRIFNATIKFPILVLKEKKASQI